MLVDVALEILNALIQQCQFSRIEVAEAEINQRCKCEPEDEDADHSKCPIELDITIKDSTIYHWQIQAVNDILDNYNNVEMIFDTESLTNRDGLHIYEKELE